MFDRLINPLGEQIAYILINPYELIMDEAPLKLSTSVGIQRFPLVIQSALDYDCTVAIVDLAWKLGVEQTCCKNITKDKKVPSKFSYE